MKKLMIFLFCLSLMSTVQAQETVKMNPENVQSSKSAILLDSGTNPTSYVIPDIYVVAFHSNPLKFAKDNFSIQQLITDNDSRYDEYSVYFRSPKGKLVVNYDEEGKTISTHQKFKNVVLPYKMGRSIYKNHKGWKIVGNKYVASSRNGDIQKEFYKIKLQNGKETKTLKLEVDGDKSMLGLTLK